MIVEGYKVNDCPCGLKESLEFVDILHTDDGKPRFILMCPPCGHGTTVSSSKEAAVNAWNKATSVLLG